MSIVKGVLEISTLIDFEINVDDINVLDNMRKLDDFRFYCNGKQTKEQHNFIIWLDTLNKKECIKGVKVEIEQLEIDNNKIV